MMKEAWNLARQGALRFGGKPRDYIACAMRLIAQDHRIADYPPGKPSWPQAVGLILAYALTLLSDAPRSLWVRSRLQPLDVIGTAVIVRGFVAAVGMVRRQLGV